MKMEGIFVFTIFCVLLRMGTGQSSEHDSFDEMYYLPSEESMDSGISEVSCFEDDTCGNPADEPVDQMQYGLESPEHLQLKDPQVHKDKSSGHHDNYSYFKICEKLHKKMKELESLHPELATLKFELLRKLDEPGFEFDSKCKDGESIVTKILDFVVYIADKLKAEFVKKLHKKPVLDKIVVTETLPVEEVIAEENEHDYLGFVGSVRGIPGEHYPNYSEVPITSFSCSDKKYVPGFYADLETGCQVFHVCYEHRRESFLCPQGTIFNQPILACDYWYSSNCSQAPLYYDVNAKANKNVEVSKEETNIGNLIATIIEGDKAKQSKKPSLQIPKGDLQDLLKFLPIKAKIVEFKEQPKQKPTPKMFAGFVKADTKVVPKPKKPVVIMPKIIKPLPLIKPKLAVLPFAKSKYVAAGLLPMAKAKLSTAFKSKVVASAAVPIVKAKVISAAAIPVAKVAIPIKSKFVTLPLIKSKYVAASVPVFKAKTIAKVIPYVKMTSIKPKIAATSLKFKSAAASIPVMKAKYAKAAMISPLTKKALALGYIKLLKAKKLALMG